MIAVIMKTTMSIYREVIVKRLNRKKAELELSRKGIEIEATPTEKRKFVELKAKVEELETVIDIADSLCEIEDGNNGNLQQKDS